jgi:hypothetical protein
LESNSEEIKRGRRNQRIDEADDLLSAKLCQVEIGGAFSLQRRCKMYTQFWSYCLKGRDLLQYIYGTGERIILKWVLNEDMNWIMLVGLGTSVGLLRAR